MKRHVDREIPLLAWIPATAGRPMTGVLALLFVLTAIGAGTASAGTACVSSCSYAAPAGSGALLVFSGHGWGHGAGMSQYGAYGYEAHGSPYDQIIAPSYPGRSL